MTHVLVETLTATRTALGGSGLSVGGGLVVCEVSTLEGLLDQHKVVVVELSYLDYQVILLMVLLTLTMLVMLLRECSELLVISL